MNSNKIEMKAPKINGWVTLIAIVLIALIIDGLSRAKSGQVVGIIETAIAVLMFVGGLKRHPDKPITYGVIKVWGNYVRNVHAVVSGWAVLLPWFPFYIDTTPVDMTLDTMNGEVSDTTTKDGVPVHGRYAAGLRASVVDLVDFIGSGGMEGVKKNLLNQFEKIIRRECRLLESWRDVQAFSEGCEERIIAQLDTSKLGVVIENVSVILTPPPDLLKQSMDLEIEKLEALGEMTEFRTTLAAAEERLESMKLHWHQGDGPLPSLDSIIKEINRERMIKENGGFVIDTSGGNANVILTDAKLNAGGKRGGN